jgi:hypothetical protein
MTISIVGARMSEHLNLLAVLVGPEVRNGRGGLLAHPAVRQVPGVIGGDLPVLDTDMCSWSTTAPVHKAGHVPQCSHPRRGLEILIDHHAVVESESRTLEPLEVESRADRGEHGVRFERGGGVESQP